MTRTRKIITATIAAATLGLTVASTSTPAAAWGWKHHHHRGFGYGGGAIAAGLIGGLALGAIAASAETNYYSCVARQPVTNSWGDVVGYRRVRVAC